MDGAGWCELRNSSALCEMNNSQQRHEKLLRQDKTTELFGDGVHTVRLVSPGPGLMEIVASVTACRNAVRNGERTSGAGAFWCMWTTKNVQGTPVSMVWACAENASGAGQYGSCRIGHLSTMSFASGPDPRNSFGAATDLKYSLQTCRGCTHSSASSKQRQPSKREHICHPIQYVALLMLCWFALRTCHGTVVAA